LIGVAAGRVPTANWLIILGKAERETRWTFLNAVRCDKGARRSVTTSGRTLGRRILHLSHEATYRALYTLLVAGVIFFVREVDDKAPRQGKPDAVAELDLRLARGEIDADDYSASKKLLMENRQ
jgi:putative membrane protein